MPARGSPRWLLIGNSRWHWAEHRDQGLRVWDEPPRRADAGAGANGSLPALRGWAAVGSVPQEARLNPATRLGLEQVPLEGAPAWLGIDRALAGWRAWQQTGGPVLVVDAGTAVSLTRVDGGGRFRGGRLMAGLSLQLRALAEGTAALPAIAAEDVIDHALGSGWPIGTRQAMATGVTLGLTAAILEASREAVAEEPACRILLTGGDASLLVDGLIAGGRGAGLPLLHRPSLVMEALVALDVSRT